MQPLVDDRPCLVPKIRFTQSFSRSRSVPIRIDQSQPITISTYTNLSCIQKIENTKLLIISNCSNTNLNQSCTPYANFTEKTASDFFLLPYTLHHGLYHLEYNLSMNMNPFQLSNQISTYIFIYPAATFMDTMFERASSISRGVNQSIIFNFSHVSSEQSSEHMFSSAVSMVLLMLKEINEIIHNLMTLSLPGLDIRTFLSFAT